jgi:hypothetical protein
VVDSPSGHRHYAHGWLWSSFSHNHWTVPGLVDSRLISDWSPSVRNSYGIDETKLHCRV